MYIHSYAYIQARSFVTKLVLEEEDDDDDDD